MGKYYVTVQDIQQKSLSQKDVLEVSKHRRAVQDAIEDHDCKASPDSGCSTCGEIQDLIEEEQLLEKEGYCVDKNGTCEEENCNCWK